jgi:hypothetical protein
MVDPRMRMKAAFDFLSHCRPGMTLLTGDRRRATITAVDREAGLIHGEVQMFGPCSWRADGLWTDAPCGASGPLDLAAPASDAVAVQRRASIVDQLDGSNRHFCCD